MSTVQFFLSSIIIILMPGTGVAYTVSHGLLHGKRAAFYAAFGCTLGIIPHLLLSLLLSGFLLQLNHSVFQILQIIGALYLIYLGIGMILAKSASIISNSPFENGFIPILRQGILINLLNPKLTLFFFSFLPQYIQADRHYYIAEYLWYGILFMLLTLIVFMGYGFLSGSVNRFFLEKENKILLMQKIFGLLFLVFAVMSLFNF